MWESQQYAKRAPATHSHQGSEENSCRYGEPMAYESSCGSEEQNDNGRHGEADLRSSFPLGFIIYYRPSLP
jgi:hypothetical protein